MEELQLPRHVEILPFHINFLCFLQNQSFSVVFPENLL